MQVIPEVMPYSEWVDGVRATIGEDWLGLIDGSQQLSDELSRILRNLHQMYQPQQNGTWSASPRWSAMFKWTACPLNKVRAVILLKCPKAANVYSQYESTGYGAGVQRKEGGSGQSISAINTVWTMLEVARQCLGHPDSSLPNLVEGKYHNGFNPECLSARGILFLNVAQTSRHVEDQHGIMEKGDVELWQELILELLEAMPGEKIPLFQWYLTMDIDNRLTLLKETGRFLVSKPEALKFRDGHSHICYFRGDQIRAYVDELKATAYAKHRNILKKIFQSMVCESEVQTYAAPEATQ